MMNFITRMVLALIISMSTANKVSMRTVAPVPQHVAERCVAIDSHTFKAPDGNMFTISANCDDLLISETYRVVFCTFGTRSRKDDEIVDFDELEVYELYNGIGNPIKWGALD